MVPDCLGVVARDGSVGEEVGEQPCAGGGDLVEVERPGGPRPEGALGHDGQHPRAGRRFEHDIAGPDGGGLQRGVGERQRRRELLKLELLLGAPGLRGFQCGEGLQHAEHGGGAVGTRPGLAPHGAAIVLEEEHQRRLGRLVGVLPHPAALGIARAEGAGHGLAQRGRVEGTACFQRGQQRAGGGEEGGRLGGGDGPRCGGGRCWNGGGGRTSVQCGRLKGVEHGAGSGRGGA